MPASACGLRHAPPSGYGRHPASEPAKERTDEDWVYTKGLTGPRIITGAAPSPELLFVPEFPPRGPYQHSFHLWNTVFPWNPIFGQWGSVLRDQKLAGQFYLKDHAGAPLIEYSRELFENPEAIVRGRVYWNTDFAIYPGPYYDTKAFGLWYDKMVRWLRKNGRKVGYQYWLPGALQIRSISSEELVQ